MPMPPARRFAALVLGLSLLVGCKTDGGAASGDPSGTYEAKSPEGTVTIEFKSDHKFHMTMQTAGAPGDAADGDYMLDGDKVTLQVPGGMPLVLTRNGKLLEASLMGQILHFEKK